MIKKNLIWICITAMTILSLAGCSWSKPVNSTPLPGQPGSANGTNAPNQQPTPVVLQATPLPNVTEPALNMTGTITIWYQWGGAYLDASKQIFQAYEASHPGVIIQLVQPQNLHSVLPEAIQKGLGPDIVDITNNEIGGLAQAGNIIELGYLGIDQKLLESTFEPATIGAVTFKDKIWALPESEQGIALIYNTDMLTGDAIPKGGNDFGDLLNKAQDFAAKNPGKYLFCNQGLGNPDAAAVAPIFFGFGVPTYVDDNGKVYINTTEAVRAGQWMEQLKPFAPTDVSYTKCMNMFINRQVAAMWTGPFAIPQIKAGGINFAILPMGRPFVDVNVLMVTKNAADRGTAELTMDIMKYYTNAENAEKLALAGGIVPANSAALNSEAVSADPVLSGFGAALKLGVPTATTPYSNFQWQPVANAALNIWIGKQSPENALADAAKAITDAIGPLQ
jgi:arabinogalactan oligomer / maltooligosaccharide transport system substrate-binding protein